MGKWLAAASSTSLTPGAREDGACLLGRQRLVQLERDRLGMGAQHRHANAGRHDRKLGQVEHLARLFDHLVLFLVVAVLGHLGVVREEIEGDLVREDLALDRLAGGVVAHLVLQLLHGLGTRARRRLISRDDDLLHAGRLVDRPYRDGEDGRRAVRVGDQPVMAREVARVHLGHHQRHLGVHAEGR